MADPAGMMRRIRVVTVLWCRALLCFGLLPACHGQGAADAPVVMPGTLRDEFTLSIDSLAVGAAVNRLLLGSNVQWVDHGDGLIDDQGTLRAPMLGRVQALHAGILRYPGGSQADVYHWARGVGAIADRGDNEHFNARRMQLTVMGTQEFLELCEATSAQALITVNVPTGTPEEAANWVALTNRQGLISRRTGRKLSAVKYWEIGNEPYLKDAAQPRSWMSPEDFATRAQAIILAMRKVDESILIGVPVTNDLRNGYPATVYPGFTRRILALITAPIDYVSIHDAYLPFAMERPHTRAALYWGAMAATHAVQGDLQAMRDLLREVRPTQRWPFALTEYNAIFTLGRGDTDDLIASPVAALYVADLLRLLTQTGDVSVANYWSLSGNWWFGAMTSDGGARPAYAVLTMFSEFLRGDVLPFDLHAQSVSTPSVGGSAAVQDLPLIESAVTREGRALRILLVHKDDTRTGHGLLHLRGAGAHAGRIDTLGFEDLWAAGPGALVPARHVESLAAGSDIAIEVPPHSVSLVTLELAPP